MLRKAFFLFSLLFLAGCVTGQAIVRSGTVTVYYPEGGIRSVSTYENGKLNGIRRNYRADGSLASAETYKNNKLDGFKNTYYLNDAAWRTELYRNGKRVEMVEYDPEGRMIFEQQNY